MHKRGEASELNAGTKCASHSVFLANPVNQRSKNQRMKAAKEPRCIKTPLNVNISHVTNFQHRVLMTDNKNSKFDLNYFWSSAF